MAFAGQGLRRLEGDDLAPAGPLMACVSPENLPGTTCEDDFLCHSSWILHLPLQGRSASVLGDELPLSWLISHDI